MNFDMQRHEDCLMDRPWRRHFTRPDWPRRGESCAQTRRLTAILMWMLALLTHPAAAQVDCTGAPDLVLYNGVVLTMDADLPQAEAIAVAGDSITAVGSDSEVRALAVPGCGVRQVDLGGLTVLPGFNDSHAHWFSWREHICSVDGATTYPELETIMRMLSENGWTSISELNFGRPDHAPEHLNNAMDLAARAELPIRLNGYWGTLDDGTLLDVLADSGRTPSTFYHDRVRAPGVKMYVDDPFGTADILTQEQTTELVERAHAAGWQVAAHAVNESAVEKILTAYEHVIGAGSNAPYRHRIEHAVKVTDNQLGRMGEKGILASFQLLGPPDWPSQETFQTYISNTNPQWALRWQDFDEARSAGLETTGSTDAPFNDAPCDYSPFRVIYQAVTRQGYLDRLHADWELAQRLTIASSLRSLTRDGAYATFEENRKGTLTPGKWADLVVVSRNPLAVATPDELLDIAPLLTMVGGIMEYCDEAALSDFCQPSDYFQVDSLRITASAFLPGQTPDLAFDGVSATTWGAGAHPPQWISADVGEEIQVSSIELLVDQFPAGRTVHRIDARGGRPLDTFQTLVEFDGVTESDDRLTYTAPDDIGFYRHFRIHTTESPSWVAWKDIRIARRAPVSSDSTPHAPRFELEQNHPHPTGGETTFAFTLAEPSVVTLLIFDVLGREVARPVSGSFPAGRTEHRWSASDLANGVYFYRLEAGGRIQGRTLVVQR